MTSPARRRILMVEDEPDIQAIARLALEAIGGFSVRMCSSGAEAIAAGPTFAPDLILLDVMMPGMDGPTTLQAMRREPKLAGTPVLFMTAKVQPHELAQYRDLGVLDVLPKPFDPMTLAATLQVIWQQQKHADTQVLLDEIAASYAAHVPEKIIQIEQTWATAQKTWSSESLSSLQRLAHALHGSGASLGFVRLGAAAADLDRYLGRLRPAAPGVQQEIDQLIAALHAAAADDAQAHASAGDPADERERPEHATPSSQVAAQPAATSADDNRLIYLVGTLPAQAQDLAAQLGYFGYSVESFEDAKALRAMGGNAHPAAVIACAKVPGGEVEVITAARQIDSKVTPIICVSEYGDIATRLRAVRLGVDGFFTLPVNMIAMVDRLDALTAHYAPDPYRILIVDDEPELAYYHAARLGEAGMLTTVITNPIDVMQPLAEFRPDMILMDMYMPGCDGMDLAAVIRQQEDYIGIPIVFLSAETNRDMQLEAMRLGGDDFMTKPILPDHLISAVTSRVERSRAVRSFMVRDGLTGLFNHTTTKEWLELELARARRYQLPLSFAIIDIDRFKSVNDTYGHSTGDHVLKSLARLLQQRLRRSEIIGRYGGEEFAVVLAGADGPTALGILDELRVGLARIRQQAGERSFTVTFSGGVASFPTYGDGLALTDAADRALYQAKRSGRNRIVLAAEESPAAIKHRA
jgi:diguanylate cyclase (GGDEF)-like protein